jgi:hypothetical protein
MAKPSIAKHDPLRISYIPKARPVRSFEIFWSAVHISADETGYRAVRVKYDQRNATPSQKSPQGASEPNKILYILAIDQVSHRN